MTSTTRLSSRTPPDSHSDFVATKTVSPEPFVQPLSDLAIKTLSEIREFLPKIKPRERPIERLLKQPDQCTALKEIDPRILTILDQKSLSDSGLQRILSYCPSIEKLNLSGFTQITDAALPHIAALRQLTSLDLSSTQVRHLDPLIQNPLSNLRKVHFYQTPVEFESIRKFLNCHTKITHLTLPKNPPVDFFDRIPSDLLQKVTIHLSESTANEKVVKQIFSFATKAPSLKKLQIWHQDTPSPAITPLLFSNCKAEVIYKTNSRMIIFKPVEC